MKKTNDSTFDRIYKYYFNQKTNVALSATEEAIRERWDFAWKLLANMFTRRQVVEAMTQRFSDIHKAIAYDDMNKAMMLFGDPRNANKEAKKALSEEWITKGIKKAWDDQDLDAYERLIGRYNKLNKLEDEENEGLGSILKNLKANQIIIVSEHKDLEEEVNRMQEELTNDVEFTEFDDED